MDHSTLRRVAAAAAAAVGLTGLAVYTVGGAGPAEAFAARVRAEGVFGVDREAFTYDPAVPVGARTRVQAIYTGGGRAS